MSQIDTILEELKKADQNEKRQLLEYLLHMRQNGWKPGEAEKEALVDFVCAEADGYLTAIPAAESYREKDQYFACEDLMLGLVMGLYPSAAQIPPEKLVRIMALTAMVDGERTLERAVDALFDPEGEGSMASLLAEAEAAEEEYRRGKLWEGLNHYRAKLDSLPESDRRLMAEYLNREFRRYLHKTPGRDEIGNLELMADICVYFKDEQMVQALRKTMELGHDNINFYGLRTLLEWGEDVPGAVIDRLARNLEYANLTHMTLKNAGKTALYPAEFASEEYLAKSDLVRWLTYPTELGRTPDAIELIGKSKKLFRKETFYIFRFRSDSETLGDRKNKWLIGWSSDDGGTFSNFDEYAPFERETPEATAKYIHKKLIG